MGSGELEDWESSDDLAAGYALSVRGFRFAYLNICLLETQAYNAGSYTACILYNYPYGVLYGEK